MSQYLSLKSDQNHVKAYVRQMILQLCRESGIKSFGNLESRALGIWKQELWESGTNSCNQVGLRFFHR